MFCNVLSFHRGAPNYQYLIFLTKFKGGKGGGAKAGVLGVGTLLLPGVLAGVSQSGASPVQPQQNLQQHGGRNSAGYPDYGAYDSRRYPANPRNFGVRAPADIKMILMAVAVLYKLA